MQPPDYRWALEMRRSDGSRLGQVAISPDWNAARECMRFAAARRGLIPLGAAVAASAATPLWHATLGAPFASGFTASLDSAAPGSEHRFPIEYFSTAAREASARFVAVGALQPGDKFVYFPLAYLPAGGAPAAGLPARAPLHEVDSLVTVRESSIREFLDRGTALGALDRDDVPLFVPQRVFDEATELTRAAPEREVGGILIGHVHRWRPDLFLEVTAQIPANASGNGTSLSFTADTWTGVRTAIALRNEGELMLGWWHSHVMSVLCGTCPLDRQRACRLARGFLSADDGVLHATVFPRAYSVALVISLGTDDTVTSAMFGWRGGALARRSVHVLDASRPGPASGTPTDDGTPVCAAALERRG